jgi:hypothetical protein
MKSPICIIEERRSTATNKELLLERSNQRSGYYGLAHRLFHLQGTRLGQRPKITRQLPVGEIGIGHLKISLNAPVSPLRITHQPGTIIVTIPTANTACPPSTCSVGCGIGIIRVVATSALSKLSYTVKPARTDTRLPNTSSCGWNPA